VAGAGAGSDVATTHVAPHHPCAGKLIVLLLASAFVDDLLCQAAATHVAPHHPRTGAFVFAVDE
jgi:hypothetical protein